MGVPMTPKTQIVFPSPFISVEIQSPAQEEVVNAASHLQFLYQRVDLKTWVTWPGFGSKGRPGTYLHPHCTLPTLSVVVNQQSIANYVFPLSFLDEAEHVVES